jgi:hypothetical protein
MSSAEINDPRIRRSALRLRLAVLVAMALLAVTLVLAWVGPVLGLAKVEIQDKSGLIDSRVAGTGAMLLIEIALFRLVQMLSAIGEGDLFSSRVIRHFRGFAFWLLLVALAGVAMPMIAALVGLHPLAGGAHRMALVISLTDVLAVGITLLLFLLARLLERARQLDEDMREIV